MAFRSVRLMGLVAGLMSLVFLVACNGKDKAKSVPDPLISISDVRGGRSKKVSLPVELEHIPAGAASVAWVLEVPIDSKKEVTFKRSGGLPEGAGFKAERREAESSTYACEVTLPEGWDSGGERFEVAAMSFVLPPYIVARKPFRVTAPSVTLADGSTRSAELEIGSLGATFFTDPVPLFAFLCGVVAFIFWLATLKAMEPFFRYLPPLIWMYFVPMVCTTIGITPDSSALYSPFMSRVILPAILVLLLIPSDVRSLVQLGLKSLIVMLIATFGIVVGALGSLALFTWLMPDSVPPDAWKGIAALSGSWIGGSPNLTAVVESIGTPPSMIGPLVIVDTVLAYSWLGLLIAMSAYQTRIDHYHKADSSVIEELSARLEAEQEEHSRAPRVTDVALMFGVAFVVSRLCVFAGGPIYDFFNETLKWKGLCEVVNGYGWAILLITAVGLLLSTTKLRHLDYCGASSIGYVGLYLLLTTYGAQANLRAIFEVPIFFGLGFVWLVIHIVILYIGLRLMKAPLFLAATSSMANIGGTASAPVVAAAYNQSMAPVGLLMAILGSVMGTPIALFVVATVGKMIAGQ